MSTNAHQLGAARLRAQSPAVVGLATAVLAGGRMAGGDPTIDPANVHRDIRVRLISSAMTVEEVIACVHSDYREVLREPLLSLAATVSRLASAKATLEKWNAHQRASTIPPHLRIKEPEVQLTKGFRESDACKKDLAAQKVEHEARQKAIVDNAVKLKGDDVTFLERLLEPTKLFAELQPLVTRRTDILAESRKIVSFTEGANGPVDPKFEADPSVVEIGRQQLRDSIQYAYRVIALTQAKEDASKAKQAKKREVHDAAEVEMADGTADAAVDKSTAQHIASAVAAEMKKLKNTAKASRIATTSRVTTDDPFWVAAGIFVLEEEVVDFEGQQATRRQELGPRQGVRTEARSQAPAVRSHEGQQEAQEARRREGREEGWEGQGQGPVIRSYVYGRPSTLPDWILTIPFPQAVSLVVLNVPMHIRLASKFRHYVHLSPGVNLPENISYNLAVGMKYMYYQPLNKKLISASWRDFQRRLRWRLFFSFQGNDAPFDPDYEIIKPIKKEMVKQLPLYLELGLVAGRRFVNQTIAKIPDNDVEDNLKSLTPSPRHIRDYLLAHEYVVTATDKNLGLAVSKRDWIIEKSLEIFTNEADYALLDAVSARIILDKKCIEMESIALIAAKCIDHLEGTVSDFLRSKITSPGDAHVVPTFYGIPKIHKVPTKMRPIIPCHSAIMNPAAKYVSKKLKPIVKSAPTIIHGSKDLAIKLSQLKLKPGRKWYIVTGDVVAFYPNVPLDKCLKIVYDMYMNHYWWNRRDHDEELCRKEQEVFRRCLYVGNTELLAQFQDQTRKQLRGLAMGVADSPDLANLYGWHFENVAKIMDDPLIEYYGRYIDDCFAIVYADSDREALQYVSNKIKFDGCTIEWNASAQFAPFLDMTVYKDENNKLQHMPYRKAQNHHERIPWISHHPLDVKRGTFIGEMSRLATLSSVKAHYLESIKGLVALYIKRGYPQQFVGKWMKDNLKKRWDTRLALATAPEHDVLVLKTEYNTAWNYFQASQLGDTILGYWREYLDRHDRRDFNSDFPPMTEESATGDVEAAGSLMTRYGDLRDPEYYYPDIRKLDILNRRVITSRKRTKNMFDFTNLWKKIVLTKLDEHEVEEDRPVFPDIIDYGPAPVQQAPNVPFGEGEVSDSDEELYQVRRHRSPDVPIGWRLAQW